MGFLVSFPPYDTGLLGKSLSIGKALSTDFSIFFDRLFCVLTILLIVSANCALKTCENHLVFNYNFSFEGAEVSGVMARVVLRSDHLLGFFLSRELDLGHRRHVV